MSTRFNAKQICEMALEDIGVISANEQGAGAEHLRRALARLDLTVAHLSGAGRCFWLIPDTLSIPLTATTQSYDLIATLASDAPDEGIQFPVAARLVDPNGNESPVTIVTRESWTDIADRDAAGSPELVWIDRLNTPTMHTWPTLGDTTAGYAILLDVQTFGPDLTSPRKETSSHQLRLSWQAYLVHKLAAWLGNGPIRNLGAGFFRLREAIAKQHLDELLAFENRQHDTEPPICDSNEDFGEPTLADRMWP
jgi:hypothetical protein